MPTIEEYRLHLIRSDYGLLYLVAGTALCVLITILLWRRSEPFRRMANVAAPGIIPLATFPANPVLSLLQLPTVLAPALKLPSLSPALLALIALVLRLPIMFTSFWYDEAFTARLATLSLPRLPAAIMADTHPPLFYSFIWAWARLAGHSEFMLRVPSLLCGVLSVLLLYRLVIAAGLDRRVALIAGLLCAVTPAAIYYSTELRPYAMLICAVFGSLICIFEDRHRAFIVCAALIAWLHNFGLLYVPVIGLVALAYQWKQSRLNKDEQSHLLAVLASDDCRIQWIRAVIMACVLGAFWLPLAIQQSSAVANGFWITFDVGIPFQLFTLNLIYMPREFLIPLLLPYVAILLLGFWVARRWLVSSGGQVIMFLTLMVPAIAVLVSLFWSPVFLPRVFLPITLLALIPLAYAIGHLPIMRAIAAPVLLTGLVVFYGSIQLIRPPYREIISEGCAGADVMYATAIDTAITVSPYWSGPMLVWLGSTDRGGTFMPDQLPLYGFRAGDISELSGNRVCLVYVYTPRTLQPERDLIQQITQTYPFTLQRHDLHPELRIDVYQIRVVP